MRKRSDLREGTLRSLKSRLFPNLKSRDRFTLTHHIVNKDLRVLVTLLTLVAQSAIAASVRMADISLDTVVGVRSSSWKRLQA